MADRGLRRLAGFLPAAALLGAFAFLAASAAGTKGPTFDETAHLAAGISYARTGDFRMNPEHPALPKLLAGWSATVAGATCDTSTVAWRRSEQWDFARETLWRDGAATWRRVLDAGRAPMVGVGVALGAVIWIWARAMIGAGGATVALVLFAFCPNVLAHAPLVTTDVPLAFTVVATAACLWAARRTGAARWIVAAAFFFALSMTAKFSAFSYGPVWIVLAALPSIARPPRRALVHAALFAALGFAFTQGVVAATYGRLEWSTIAELGLRGRGVDPESMSLLRRIPYEILARVPWPSADFARGFKDILLYTEAGHPVYLLGRRGDSGWWWSSFVALGAKATLPLLLLAAAGAIVAWRTRRGRAADLAYVVAPAALCLATNVAANLGIGVRHLLPMFPFLMLLAAWPLRGGGFPGGAGAFAVFAGLLVWHAGAGIGARPDYIAYFNEAAGGARGGYRLLGDSNLDWGQDLPAAAERLRALGAREAILCYFGTMNPFALEMRWQVLPPSQREKRFDPWVVTSTEGPLWLAMSATNRQGIYARGAGGDTNALPYPWLEGITPREVVGGTIFLYEISGEVEALKGLVTTSLRYGLREEAYAALVRWNALAPEDAEARRKLEEARAAGMGGETDAGGGANEAGGGADAGGGA